MKRSLEQKNKELKLELLMYIKWGALIAKYPNYNAQFLNDMHKVLDWYEKQVKEIKKKKVS